MLTYQIITSTALLTKGSFTFGLVWMWPDQNSKKAKQTNGDFLDFVVWKTLPKFFLVNGFKLIDGLTAQLLWRFHVLNLTRASRMKKDGTFVISGKVRHPWST
jgi:hypothetical protein